MSRWLPMLLILSVTTTGCSKNARLSRRCNAGDGAACTQLAARLAVGHGAARDAARAAQLFRQAAKAYDTACSGGEAAACVAVGEAYLNAVGVAQDDSAAARVLDRACTAGNARGCLRLAFVASRHRQITGLSALPLVGDADVAALRRGCDSGEATACLHLGLRQKGGDNTESAALFRKACDGGDSTGCFMLAEVLPKGSGVGQDVAESDRLMRREAIGEMQSIRATAEACRESGDPVACVAFADMCLNGRVPNWMRTRAGEEEGLLKESARILDDLCAASYWAACVRLGFYYTDGTGGRQPPLDAAKGLALYERACDGGLWTACHDAGQLYSNGRGMPHDPAKAAELLSRACENGLEESCAAAEASTATPQTEPGVDTPPEVPGS